MLSHKMYLLVPGSPKLTKLSFFGRTLKYLDKNSSCFESSNIWTMIKVFLFYFQMLQDKRLPLIQY